jgi:hypothetical protein
MILVALACLLPVLAFAARINILVPAYANPCCDGGPQMWTSLIASATSARSFTLGVIFNPTSGPGTARDPNYLDAQGNGPLRDLRLAGGVIDGYVATTNATRPIADVKHDIDVYLTGFYAGSVNGLFFDEVSNDLGDVGYYRQIYSYVQSIRPGTHTVGNPGTGYVTNRTGQTTYGVADFLGMFETLVTFENTGAVYTSGYTSLPYLQGLGSKKIAHIIHTQGAWDAAVVATAAARGAGYLYMTDWPMPNPFDQMPSYWSQFVAAVQAINAADAQAGNNSDVPALPAGAFLFLAVTLLMTIRIRRSRG